MCGLFTGTLQATCHLMKQLKVEVLECLVLIELSFLKGRDKVPYKVHSLIKYD